MSANKIKIHKPLSPLFEARVAGFAWLMTILTSMVGFLVVRSLIVSGNAAATATNILNHESLFRFAFVATLIGGAFYMGVTVLVYGLLKPVNRNLSLFAAFCGVAGIAIGAAGALNFLAPLGMFGSYAAAFTPNQWQEQALAALKLDEQGFNLSMVYFGLQCVSAGYLIARSTFIPRILGVLLAIGGASYVISSFATLLSPSFGGALTPLIIPAALIGEGSLTVWLLVKGVNEERWNALAE